MTFKIFRTFCYYSNAALNFPAHISLYSWLRDPLGHTPGSYIAGSWGIRIYNLIRASQILSHMVILASTTTSSITLTSLPILGDPILSFANLMSVKCYLIAVLICISLISCEVIVFYMSISNLALLCELVSISFAYFCLCVCFTDL